MKAADKKSSNRLNSATVVRVKQLKVVHSLQKGEKLVGLEKVFAQLFRTQLEKKLFK